MSAHSDHEDGPPNAPARESLPSEADTGHRRNQAILDAVVNRMEAKSQQFGGTRAGTLIARHAALRGYLQTAVIESDWHAVSDAANDLRCVEAELRCLGAEP